MGDEIFSVYLTPADYSKLAYAKLDLPASPWKLLDALDDDDDVQNTWHNLENEEDLDR